jgi:hypothetical protein
MELDASQLYADKTTVEFGRELTSAQKKALLQATLSYAKSLGIEGLEVSLEKTSSGGLFSWSSNKALVLSCPLGDFEFNGLLTLQPVKDTCVLGIYKLLLGEELFAVNQSAEVRRRVVINTLRDVEVVDYFFLIDKATDWVAEFLHTGVKEILGAAKS